MCLGFYLSKNVSSRVRFPTRNILVLKIFVTENSVADDVMSTAIDLKYKKYSRD